MTVSSVKHNTLNSLVASLVSNQVSQSIQDWVKATFPGTGNLPVTVQIQGNRNFRVTIFNKSFVMQQKGADISDEAKQKIALIILERKGIEFVRGALSENQFSNVKLLEQISGGLSFNHSGPNLKIRHAVTMENMKGLVDLLNKLNSGINAAHVTFSIYRENEQWLSTPVDSSIREEQAAPSGRNKLIDFYVPAYKNKVALTFDDGPNDSTGRILDILKAAGLHATFFVLETQIVKHPEFIKRMFAEGHTIGIHDTDHRVPWTHFPNISEVFLHVHRVQDAIARYTDGKYKATLVRPPYGAITEEQAAALRKEGFRIVCWSAAPEEDHPSSAEILESVSHSDKPGTIFLFHDHSHNTVEALTEIIRSLKHRSAGVSELLDKVD